MCFLFWRFEFLPYSELIVEFGALSRCLNISVEFHESTNQGILR